ncbi:hypothetical protein HBH53_243760 [Parastagonospora nodorum]|nr:hypothetical protein HBH53_243760 [Parastagonospora nodorum]KAH4371028.1 hypothetical protein HBH99_236720 [Parastagonospora nodorum]KAH4710531.1 hypothetical protein HBH67_036870 [Parastagonospora nodorum]KAH4967947.1 hypothetical protein HBI78_076100 [Parastagonospora nodorum]KAH5121643.1 hypothetical protein HBH71_059730 [Parastagonospora nodorum]
MRAKGTRKAHKEKMYPKNVGSSYVGGDGLSRVDGVTLPIPSIGLRKHVLI